MAEPAVPSATVSRMVILFIASLAALLISLLVVTGIGSVHYGASEVIAALRQGPAGSSAVDITVWSLRLPRIVLAALVGSSLSAAGLAFQTLLRNDLADPYIVGVSSGASVGAEVILVRHGQEWLRGLAVPLAAFAGAMSAMLVVYTMGRKAGRVQVTTLLLSGVIVSSFFGAIATLLLELDNPGDASYIISRLMGSLQDATFVQCCVTMIVLVAGFLILAMESRAMNVYTLGEEQAAQLGLDTERFKTTMIIVGSLLTATSVAVAGIIGFVGLIVPHVARRLCATPDIRRVLPICVVIGAVLMVWADALARSIMPSGQELPVGVITAFLGAPFFLILLRRQAGTA